MKNSSAPKAQRITLKMILEHVQAARVDLGRKIDGVDMKLSGRIDSVEKRLTAKIDALADRLGSKIAWMNAGNDNIDARLEELEMKRIPRIEAKLGMRRGRIS